MEQSLAEQAAAAQYLTSLPLPLNSPQRSLTSGLGPLLAVQRDPRLATYSSAMPLAAFGSPSVRFQSSSSSLSPDPPASGPAATMTATARLRTAVSRAAAANAESTARRSSRGSRRAVGESPLVAAVAAASSSSHEPPRRSQRTRKRPPAANRDPPTKKQKRSNLKQPPPGSVKSDDDDNKSEEGKTITASCCICMDEPKPEDLAAISGCDHLFCFECIEKWAERENSCPLCKVRFSKIERVNKAKRKKGESSKNTKRVKQKDQRSDIAPGAALEGLLASFAASANFPPHRVARLIFSGMGAPNPFSMLAGPSALRSTRAAAPSNVERALEDSLFSSDTDDDEDNSFLPTGNAPSFADFFRSVPLSNRTPGSILMGGGLGGPTSISLGSSFDPPPGRNYASNSGDRNAGRQAENPLEIEDDSEDEDIEVVQVTRPV